MYDLYERVGWSILLMRFSKLGWQLTLLTIIILSYSPTLLLLYFLISVFHVSPSFSLAYPTSPSDLLVRSFLL